MNENVPCFPKLQINRFAKVYSYVSDFNNKTDTSLLLYSNSAFNIISKAFLQTLRIDSLIQCKFENSSATEYITAIILW